MMHPLNGLNWEFKARNPDASLTDDFTSAEGWLPATVPGTVHTDLLAAGQIPDPYYGKNEHDLQWIGETDWLYRATFDAPTGDAAHLDLTFDGLDTIATVWLNGEQVLASDNMFVPQRVPVEGRVRAGRNNLWLHFASAFRYGKAQEAEHGALHVWNGDASRVYVRKAQYHYGWDWGPTFITAGVWRDAHLHAYTARLSDVQVMTDLSDDLSAATVRVTAQTAGEAEGTTVRATLTTPDGERVKLGDDLSVTLSNPSLWWPAGYGAQALHTLRVELVQGDAVLDTRELRVGLRRVDLMQEPLEGQPGRTFYFRVNHTPIFCGGVNWIPDDLFLPRVTEDRYRARLQAAVDAHMVMVRVWGGGVYEADTFYDLCDELGLMVWQDFMFGCGLYPAHDTYADSVRLEAEANVRRLRHHASLVVWCGNNEDYQLAQSIGRWGPQHPDATPADFPALRLYEQVLPDVVARLDPQRRYVPGSAYSELDALHYQTDGDIHSWQVWGQTRDYRDYPQLGGRFVSEFGMCAAPALETIAGFCPPSERTPHSTTFTGHNKATDGPAKLDAYLAHNYADPQALYLPEYVYGTQLVQADALTLGVSAWRRAWRGEGARETSGALVWQLNDCWPVSSWALIDSDRRAKPAYYALKRVFAPLAVGLTRDGEEVSAWVASSERQARALTLRAESYTLEGEALGTTEQALTVQPNGATEAGVVAQAPANAVVFALLLDGAQEVARFALWPDPIPAFTWPSPDVTASADGSTVRVSATRPARGVWLSTPTPTPWPDNWLDLRPGEERTLSVQPSGPVTVTALGQKQTQPA